MTRALVFILLIVASSASHAALLIEPYGGYSSGTMTGKALAGADMDSSVAGFGYGGRAGLLMNHFFILAYDYQVLSANEKPNSATAPMAWKQTTEYVTLGIQVPFGLRLLGSYGFHFKADEAATTPATYTGTAYKFGIGWMITPEVAINAEYSYFVFADKTTSTGTSAISSLYSKFQSSATFVNLSLPISFFHWGSRGASRPSN